MVRREYLLSLLLCVGCVPLSGAGIDRPGIIADLAVYTACVLFNQDKAPKPNVPRDGCEPDCTCKGTGEEKTGDGLSVVPCRCEDDCECKQKKAEPVASNEPPLVPVEPQAAACADGSCTIQPQPVRRRWLR